MAYRLYGFGHAAKTLLVTRTHIIGRQSPDSVAATAKACHTVVTPISIAVYQPRPRHYCCHQHRRTRGQLHRRQHRGTTHTGPRPARRSARNVQHAGAFINGARRLSLGHMSKPHPDSSTGTGSTIQLTPAAVLLRWQMKQFLGALHRTGTARYFINSTGLACTPKIAISCIPHACQRRRHGANGGAMHACRAAGYGHQPGTQVANVNSITSR